MLTNQLNMIFKSNDQITTNYLLSFQKYVICSADFASQQQHRYFTEQ
jgi:hypothetical protein